MTYFSFSIPRLNLVYLVEGEAAWWAADKTRMGLSCNRECLLMVMCIMISGWSWKLSTRFGNYLACRFGNLVSSADRVDSKITYAMIEKELQ
jgi:hypothetical protein